MRDGVDLELLDRYLAGETGPGESAQVDMWAARDSQNAALIETLRAQATPRAAPTVNVDVAWKKRNRQQSERATLRPWLPKWPSVVIAAAVIIAAVGVVAIRPPATQQFREFSTTAGNRATITLRDGTRLVLGPESRVRIPANFGVLDRKITLQGEAFCSVVHDEKHPFAIMVNHLMIQDVGTTFDVKAYPNDSAVSVAVVEGSVDVRLYQASPKESRHSLLHAGDIATIASADITTAHLANVDALTAWSQGGVTFDGVPLRAVVRDLERMYNLTITLSDSTLGAKHVTASFSNESPDEVLTEVTGIVGATFTRSGRSVVIRRRPAVSRSLPATPSPEVPQRLVSRSSI